MKNTKCSPCRTVVDELEPDESTNRHNYRESNGYSPWQESPKEEHAREADGVRQQPEGRGQASKLGVADLADERLGDHARQHVGQA